MNWRIYFCREATYSKDGEKISVNTTQHNSAHVELEPLFWDTPQFTALRDGLC